MSDNAGAFAAMDAHIERLRAVPGLGKDAAPEAAAKLKAKLDANVAAGVDPYGQPWKATKTGGKALVNAARRIAARAVGSSIVVELTGVEVMHHVGSARGYHGGSAKLGGFRRPLIPWKGLPGPIKAVLRNVLEERFQHLFAKGRR